MIKIVQDNDAVGFTPVGSHSESKNVTVMLGRKGNQFRVYGYIWRGNQAISREQLISDIAVTGATPEAAIAGFRVEAYARWRKHVLAVRAATQQLLEALVVAGVGKIA
jgi:hypothetical protein